MKFKKILASAVSGILICGMLPASVSDSIGNNDIGQILSSLSLKAEPMDVSAASTNMRRPLSNESPMWIVHIDSWNYPDPEKIIELVPEDVLPYVVFNISLSINWSSTEHKWLMVQDGIETARSWMKACADKGVWTMIQPASGGQCHFPDYPADYDLDDTIFGEFFKEYPNFIGYNYCEQFWGFASQDFPVTYQQRYDHFSALLKLCNKYGGYLDISWCENPWGSQLNPIAMLKTNANWEKACRTYKENFILEEKYTQSSYIADVESECFGAYLSGYCGNWGVRWDDTGWSDYPWNGGILDPQTTDQYRLSTSLPILLERMAMNGMTVIDGPELVWNDCIKSLWDGTDDEGYKYRRWDFYDQCRNVNIDIMRKFSDGTIRIPDRQEIIDRTKIVIIQDINSGSNDDKYCTYPTLFEGLYQKSTDGNLKDNHDPFKSTGRYPAIPTVYQLADDTAKSFKVQVKQSEIPSRWKTIADKQAEFNNLFPSEAYANSYAGRIENTWVTYNPNKTGGVAGATLDLKYNTCKTLDIKQQVYGSALINEYSDRIDLYMNNYDEEDAETLKEETITIAGASAKPSFTAKDRGVNQTASIVTENWSNGEYVLTVKHNGPIDISINCSGNETGRLAVSKKSTPKAPSFPDFYKGVRQYEGENFDMKNIEENITNGCRTDVTKFQGMGFLKFGTKDSAAIKDTVNTSKAGDFKWTLRYSATADVNSIDLYVNGSKVKTLSLAKGSGYSDWKTVTEQITLKAGENKIELRANSTAPCSVYLDNFRVEGDFGDSAEAPVEPINGTLIKELIVKDKENSADWSICKNDGTGSLIYGDRDITFASFTENLVGAETIRTACDSKLVTTDLAEFTAGADITVYVALDSRVAENLPSWLGNWKNAGVTMTSSNDVLFILYKKNVKSGEKVTLGTNGGLGLSANYSVFAVPQEKVIKGDLNCDTHVDVFDICLARDCFVNGFTNSLAFEAYDIDENGKSEISDLVKIQEFILGKINRLEK